MSSSNIVSNIQVSVVTNVFLSPSRINFKMSCSNIVSNIQVSVVTNVPQNFLFQVTLGFDIYSEIFLGGGGSVRQLKASFDNLFIRWKTWNECQPKS